MLESGDIMVSYGVLIMTLLDFTNISVCAAA